MKIPANGFTHAGKFHADDVFATALLQILRPDIKITRGFTVPDDFDGIVYDIGFGMFDHHQEPREYRANGVPYAAFGLLWRVLGPGLVGERQARLIDENFIQPLDLNAAFGSGDASYTRLGSDLEEYSPELTANVEKKSNIVGETTVTINGYQKQGEVSPYYAEPGDPLFERLQAIIDGDLVLDDLKTDIVEVKLWDKDTAGAYPAVREECYIEVVSYGGDTTGYQIPFNVHYTGVKTKGTFDPAAKKFTQA